MAVIAGAPGRERFLNFLEDACPALLIFGVAEAPSVGSAVQWLTQGSMSARQGSRSAGLSFTLPQAGQTFSHQLAGIRFDSEEGTVWTGLQVSPGSAATTPIMLQGGRAVFAHQRRGACSIFVLTDLPLPDVHEKLPPGHDLGGLYERLIPPLIFLRYAFGKACWHGVTRTARVIIDDPLLRRRYGYLDFERLAASMRTIGFGTTVAFIPWNYRRTSVSMQATFGGKGSPLSVCVHGCDHTGNEFGIEDGETLSQKAQLAMQRMAAHESRTRIPFDRIMVFPQGRFSTAAGAALRAKGYVAAVNTTCFPTDAGNLSLSVGEFLRPAIQVRGFPIFKRHYPGRLIDFAFDFFLGKPALIVEHHAYFRDGGRALERFVGELQRIEPAVSWPSLEDQLTRSCFVRARAKSEIDVHFATREFHLKNVSQGTIRYRMSKPEPDPTLIDRILVDGTCVPFDVVDGDVCFEVDAAPGRAMRVDIVDRSYPARPVSRGSRRYGARVGLRRILSEVRDEGEARHPVLARRVTRIARALGGRRLGPREGTGLNSSPALALSPCCITVTTVTPLTPVRSAPCP